jgi:hypothetical protein
VNSLLLNRIAVSITQCESVLAAEGKSGSTQAAHAKGCNLITAALLFLEVATRDSLCSAECQSN